jgi:putative addiction module component (TIGR02574 family)
MTESAKELERQARQLSAEERAQLAELLLESLHEGPIAEIEAAWAVEIQERVAAFERGELRTYPAEEVFAEARRIAK